MKFNSKLVLVFSLCLYSIYCIDNKDENKALLKNADDKEIWSQIFTTNIPPLQICNDIDPTKEEDEKEEDSVGYRIPKAKSNRWDKGHGIGPDAYMFDYIDYMFESIIPSLFDQIYKQAQSVKPSDLKICPDPYNQEVILKAFGEKVAGGSNKGEATNSNNKGLGKYLKNFDQAIYDTSITVPQVCTILSDWGWFDHGISHDAARKLLDKFDFNGDGRLGPKEFILFSIINNRGIWSSNQCKANCYNDIFKSKIDPIFSFIDCDRDGLISVSNLWEGLKLLKRPDPTVYNMFGCNLPNMPCTTLRTISLNDFLLKNHKTADGMLSQNEFRQGILLGYWGRHLEDGKVVTESSRAKKEERWANNGKDDIVCQRISNIVTTGYNRKLRNDTPANTK